MRFVFLNVRTVIDTSVLFSDVAERTYMVLDCDLCPTYFGFIFCIKARQNDWKMQQLRLVCGNERLK